MNMLPVKSGPSSDDLGEFQEFAKDQSSDATASRATMLSFTCSARLSKSEDPTDDPATIPSSSPPVPSTCTNNKPSRRKTKFERYSQAADKLSTPHELFYGIPPNYAIIFPFGSLGYFRRPFLPSGQKVSNFHSKSHAGIALGRSDYSNAMMFWDPLTSRFSSSADYKLDTDRSLPDAFPELIYDGAFTSRKLSGSEPPKEPFPPGAPVYAFVDNDFFSGTVTSVPTSKTPWYQVKPDDNDVPFNVNPMDLSSPDDPLFPVDRYTTEFERPLPSWVTNNSKITLSVDSTIRPGTLCLSDDLLWSFVERDRRGAVVYRYPLHDLPHTWRSRVLDGTLTEGWPTDFSLSAPRAHKVSAKGLQSPTVPSSFKQSMNKSHPDHTFWKLSYCEEYEGLNNQHTYEKMDRKHYLDNFSHIKVIPTMCVQTLKKDGNGNPDRVKSRIVALGNFEDDIWSKSERYAPVIGKANHRLLTSIAVDMGRKQKQGDCKNAFLHPKLPPNETVICKPPHGCPLSDPNEYWLMKKTCYGLRRSPRHW